MATPEKGKNLLKMMIFSVIGGVVLLLLIQALPLFNTTNSAAAKGKSFTAAGGETGAVLDPGLFFGEIRQTYALAKKYPEILDQVFCYCSCDEPPFRHKSLLSCFVGSHAAG